MLGVSDIIVRSGVVGLATALALSGCHAAVGTSGVISVPRDAASTCGQYCEEIGLSLDAVVIMANNVGCVCRPKAHASADSGSSSGMAGMAALLVAEESPQKNGQVVTQAR